MEYQIIKTGEKKPLADFYNGECFITKNRFGDKELFMAMQLGVKDWESPHTNVQFAVSLETGEVATFLDSEEYAPRDVKVHFDIVEEEFI